MEVKVEKYPNSSGLSPTDIVASPILCQCLYVIQTVTEFKNLTYRVTKSRNDVEVAVVYREGVLGIFGPPADPITLTLDPKGRCLLTILFKPVQRVCIVSPESGQIDIPSLLTLLRLIAGKGYLFCPGLPERFLAGKVCGKNVVLHRVPFKRYQSAQCPVYYQAPVFQQNINKPSLCALCPRCMQTAKLIHTLPSVGSNSAGVAVQLPMQLAIINQLKSDEEKLVFESISNSNFVITPDNDNPAGISVISNSSKSKLHALTNCQNDLTTSVPSESHTPENNISQSPPDSSIDVNGNCHNNVDVKGSDQVADTKFPEREISVEEDIQMLRSLLKKLLHNGCRRKSVDSSDLGTEIEGVKAVKEEASITLHYHLEKHKHRKVNVCRHCKKQYSTPAQLMNHIQRHEVVSVMWRKKFREQKLRRKSTFFSLTHGMLRQLKVQSVNKNKPSHLSETTVRLFLKRLSDMIPSQNGASSFKQRRHNVSEDKMAKHEAVEKQNCLGGQHFVSFEHVEKKNVQTRSAMKRTSSGLSPMQTLLEAAAIADVEHAEPNIFMNPLHTSFTPRNYQQSEIVSATSQLANVSQEPLEFSVPHKKPRKSNRLASKREKNNKTRTREHEIFTEMVEGESENVSHEQSMLTNLNLLSTVSLETAMRQQTPNNPQRQTTNSNSIPLIVSSPESKKHSVLIVPHSANSAISLSSQKDLFLAQPTSKSVSIPQQLINNTSGGNVVISKTQETCRPLINTNLHIPCVLPPIPPLLFAGDVQGQDLLYHVLSQTQQGQTQAVPVSMPSILRSLVTVKNKQPVLTAADTETTKSHSPNSNCGAIDLSKPKPPQAKPTISSGKTENDIDLSSLSGLPHNIVQLVAGNDNPSEVLQCFMMMTKSADITVQEPKDIKPVTSIISDKQTDSELQARMFASACNYRIDKAVHKTQQVHSVIASSSRTTKLGKGMKPADVAPVQADEIQCGYKWSGSGGSVKERTQMVRELVPSDVMASFLTKTQPLNKALQQLSVNLLNGPQRQQTSPELVQSSTPGWSAQSKSYDLSASESAVNLISMKSSETPVSKKVLCMAELSTQSLVISSSPPTLQWSSASPVSTKKNFLKGSLINSSEILNQLKLRLTNSKSGTSAGSPKQLQIKNVSQSSSSSPSSLCTTPTPSTASSISSPSLAAMLRQPVATTNETNHNSVLNISVGCKTSAAQQTSSTDSSVLILPREFIIKSEPLDSYNHQKGAVIISLPIKTETDDTNVEMADNASCDGDSSPAKLVVDMGLDKTHRQDVGQKLKYLASPVSTTSELTKKVTLSNPDIFYCKQTAK